MPRYIDADALEYDTEWSEYQDGFTAYSQMAIDTAPSIDIVRCKECKYWEESQYYQEFMVCTYVKGATFTRQHDDFCSRGERKESE